MSVASGEPLLERRRMSRAEFDALPREVRAEYVRGVALMSPPPVYGHQWLEMRVVRFLIEALPGMEVATEVGLDLGDSLRIPDVVVYATVEEQYDETEWMPVPPVLVVEVLSRTTRTEDLLRKPMEYLAAGIAHYWIVDRKARALTALTAGDDGWTVVLELDDDNPRGDFEVTGHGRVTLDLTTLLRRPA
jgi:Uma2 family endonuclease